MELGEEWKIRITLLKCVEIIDGWMWGIIVVRYDKINGSKNLLMTTDSSIHKECLP